MNKKTTKSIATMTLLIVATLLGIRTRDLTYVFEDGTATSVIQHCFIYCPIKSVEFLQNKKAYLLFSNENVYLAEKIQKYPIPEEIEQKYQNKNGL